MPSINANLCLVFEDGDAEIFTDLAQTHFQSIADGYCLGLSAHPHISVCQLHVETEDKISFFNDKLKDVKAPDISLAGYGRRFAGDYLWCEFSVDNTQSLLDFAAKTTAFVKEAGLQPINATGAFYHPHVTLARINRKQALPHFDLTPFTNRTYSTRLILGKSDANGQLLSYNL